MREISMSPPLWAKTGHLQTILAYSLSSPEPQFLGQNCLVSLQDGDQVDCLHLNFSSDFIYVFFHGLAGSYFSNYMKRAAAYCQKMKKTYYLFNHRGAGQIKSRKIYHSGVAPDASEMMNWVRKNNPGKKIIAVGYSMSANILLLLNGKYPHLPQADAYVSVNAPIDLETCSKKLGEGLNRIYDWKFVQDLRGGLEEDDRRRTAGVKVYDFDNLYTAPKSGFLNREDYYAQCSAQHWVSELRTPHLVLMSQDDPFIPFETYVRAQWGPQARVEFTRTGGHLGYLTKEPHQVYGRRWLDAYLHQKFMDLEAALSFGSGLS